MIGLAGAAGSASWHSFKPGWVPVLTILSALSMIVGNLAAIAQSSLRRLLAYSAVGHAGYMLLGLITHTPQSLSALLYYVLTYALASLGVFGVLSALDAEGVDSLASSGRALPPLSQPRILHADLPALPRRNSAPLRLLRQVLPLRLRH